MKKSTFGLTLAIFYLFTSLLPIFAAEAEEETNEQPPEWQMQFENLELIKRQEFGEHFVEATRLFNQKRIFEALDEILKAEKIFKDYPSLSNLKGACYVEFRNFDTARTAFEKALGLAPENGDIMFNLAEVEFVTSNWEAAEKRFNEVLTLIDDKNTRMIRLVEFKLLLSKIRLEKTAEVQELAKKYGFDDDSPFHYYAQAALSYEAKDEEKAAEWIAIAQRVFTKPEDLAPWQDTLIEFGYIRSFYGGDFEDQGEVSP